MMTPFKERNSEDLVRDLLGGNPDDLLGSLHTLTDTQKILLVQLKTQERLSHIDEHGCQQRGQELLELERIKSRLATMTGIAIGATGIIAILALVVQLAGKH